MPKDDHRLGAPEGIEVTPEMIAAGSAELRFCVMADVGEALRAELAAAVYEAMEKAKGAHR